MATSFTERKQLCASPHSRVTPKTEDSQKDEEGSGVEGEFAAATIKAVGASASVRSPVR